MFAVSSNAIPSTPYLPVSIVNATNSSAVMESSINCANVACINASISSLSYPNAFACLEYAERPFNPYVINSLKERTSSFSVERTPTSLDSAFSFNIELKFLSSTTSQVAVSDKPFLSDNSDINLFFIINVSFTLALKISSSKFAFVIVVNKFNVMK